MRSGKQVIDDNGTFDLTKTLDFSEVIVQVADAADLGGGTVEFLAKPSSISGDGGTVITTNPVAVAAGHNERFIIGRDMVFQVKVSGATSPDIPVTFSLR